MTYGPVRTRSGAILQSGVPKHRRQATAGKANGLLLRGAVLVTYVSDDAAHPEADYDAQVAVYCDCVVVANIPGARWTFLPRVLVSQDNGGLQEGRIWKPRASTLDVTENAADANLATNPANLDGDHVLIGFLNDRLNEPIILRGLPHPAADVGQEDEIVGHRMRLKIADGNPDFWKHRGAFYGVSDDGDFVVDLTQAYAGELDEKGTQPAPPADGTTGNYKVRLPDKSKLTVEIEGVAEVSVAVGEHIETLYTASGSGVKAAHDGHMHPTGTGPSGGPTITFPAWDPKIISDRSKIPDTT